MWEALLLAGVEPTTNAITTEQWIIVAIVAVAMYLLGALTLHMIAAWRRRRHKKK